MKTTYQHLFEQTSPLVESFRTDLDHDREWINAHPGESFIHLAYESGTHLFPIPVDITDNEPQPYLFGRKRPLDVYRDIYRLIRDYDSFESYHWTLYTGTRPHKSCRQEAVSVYLDALERVERNYWSKAA